MSYPCSTFKSNLQLKEKNPRQLHLSHRALLFPSLNAVFLCRQTQTRGHPQATIKTNFCLTNYWFCNNEYSNGDGHVTVCYPAVLTDTWPPKFNSSRIWADVAKRFLLADRSISQSSLGIALRGLQDRRCSSTIPVACGKHCIRW